MTYNDFTFESLGEGIEICISDEHRFGTDAFLLADFHQDGTRISAQTFAQGAA